MVMDTAMKSQTISHYDLLEKIAEGGMGTVYKGRDQRTDQIVAIKVVPKHLLNNQVFLKRFEQEYNAARALEHPNVVRALDFGRDGETPFLVMEFVEGESLGARIERDGAVEEAEAIRIASCIAEGLHHAHKLGLIHRDVKPDNILITPSGDVKLTDMGLVKELEADLNLTRTGRGLGTPHFMAPEQFRNAKKADVRCDIYSLAATLYMMVTGELPFKSLNPLDAWMKKINNDLPGPRRVKSDVSERVDWAIRRSMSADPNVRASSCRDFVDDLNGTVARRLSSEDDANQTTEWWHMVYTDDEGVSQNVKGSKMGIRRSLKENLLGDASNIRVSRSSEGPFVPLRQHADFRELLHDIETPMALTPLPPELKGPSTPTLPPLPGVSGRKPPSKIKIPSLPRPNDPSTASGQNPVFINLKHTDDDDQPLEWTKYVLFLIFGIGIGVLGFALIRVFHIRLF